MAEPTQLDRPRGPGQLGYIPTLDGWRAVAVMLVIGSHAQVMLRNQGSALAVRFADQFNHAGYGVDVFFALSGFLITGQLLDEKVRSGSVSLKHFYLRRVFRIIPPMLVYLATIGLLAQTNILPGVTMRELAAALFFFRNYVDGSWYSGHFWSLSIEEHFYAVVPLLILLLSRRRLALICLAAIGACIAIRAFELGHPAMFGRLPQFRTENRLDGLLWGAVLAQAVRTPAIRMALARWLTTPIIILLLTVVVALLFGIESQAFRRTLVAAALPLFVVYTVLHPALLAGRLLELRPIRILGRLSYSLYIWQMLFLVPGHRPLGVMQDFPLALLLPILLAFASYGLVEKPMIRLGHRLAGRRPAEIAMASRTI